MKKPMKINAIDLSDVQLISPDDLLLDAHNPRLTEFNLNVADQEEILRVLWRDKEVSELVDSIAFNGYWQQEVLFAVKENNNMVVVEGNRRLAAVKLLRSQKLCRAIGVLHGDSVRRREAEGQRAEAAAECAVGLVDQARHEVLGVGLGVVAAGGVDQRDDDAPHGAIDALDVQEIPGGAVDLALAHDVELVVASEPLDRGGAGVTIGCQGNRLVGVDCKPDCPLQ